MDILVTKPAFVAFPVQRKQPLQTEEHHHGPVTDS